MQTKADILAQLQREIHTLQGFKPASAGTMDDVGLGRIKHSFPQGAFPLSAVHEFLCTGAEDATASIGFIAGLLSSLMHKGAAALWISPARTIFPPALKAFGINPESIIFLDLRKEKDVLWALEESLKCNAVAAVVGELQELSFTDSRRLQLAVEQSGVTCFMLRRNPRNMATAAFTRWRLRSLPSRLDDELPGVGYPRWHVELLKVRNGKPGSWDIEWRQGRFRHPSKLAVMNGALQQKAG